MVLAFGVLLGILFLEETHEHKKHRRDIGLVAGRWLLKQFNGTLEPTGFRTATKTDDVDQRGSLEDDAPPGYRTTEGSPRHPSSRSHSPNMVPTDTAAHSRGKATKGLRGIKKAFTKQVTLNIIGFGLLA